MENDNNEQLQEVKIVDQVSVGLEQAVGIPTSDQALWSLIRNRTDAITFESYQTFIAEVFCQEQQDDKGSANQTRKGLRGQGSALASKNRPTLYGMDSYHLLKTATEVFLIFQCGVLDSESFPPPEEDNERFYDQEEMRRGQRPNFEFLKNQLKSYLSDAHGTLPYLDRVITPILGQIGKEKKWTEKEVLAYCNGVLKHRLTCPSFLELIWSYWHEEGMLVQTMNAITVRFQNRRKGPQDPLANLELDPLRPLNHLIWGFIQDQYNRLTVHRRAYEYDHHYGISLYGKAVGPLESADSRSKFIKAFHNLLYRASIFYQETADTTVNADGFPLLNALKEVHLILAEGAHNQYGDLPWTARVEMLMMEWLLARPQMREFLRGRHMVPYTEDWMGAVDAMKKMQGWTDTSISHFRDLGKFGEQIVLSVRFGNWIDVNDQEHAKNWARYWRPEIQSYIHSYEAVTGVDLSAETTDMRGAEARFFQPSVHLRNRLEEQGMGRVLPSRAPTVQVLPARSGSPRALPGVRRPLLGGKSGDGR